MHWNHPICFFLVCQKQIEHGNKLRQTTHRSQNARHGTYRQNAWNVQQQDTKVLNDGNAHLKIPVISRPFGDDSLNPKHHFRRHSEVIGIHRYLSRLTAAASMRCENPLESFAICMGVKLVHAQMSLECRKS